MMKKSMVALAAMLASPWLGGCVGTTATPAQHGKAYVVLGSLFSSNMYHCDATDGEPECWEVVEKELP
jgi:hypothetical protein